MNEKINGQKFRMVCYNILAEYHAGTDRARSFDYPYCTEEVLDSDFRRKQVLKQLFEYDADVICLQEVDEDAYNSIFVPKIFKMGFSGLYARKFDIPEGCATFYRKNKFTLVASKTLFLKDALVLDHNSDIYNKIKENSKLLQTVISRGSAIAITLLQTANHDHVCVCNVHLFWSDRGGHIRAIQAQLILREIDHFLQKWNHEMGSSRKGIARIVAGDFNSDPYSAAVELMTKGQVPSNHSDWFAMGKDEFQPGIVLHNDIKYQSAFGYPTYTCFVPEFRQCIDFIFIDPAYLCVYKIEPLPSHEDITRHTALPNKDLPSDHLPLVVDLELVNFIQDECLSEYEANLTCL